MNSEILYHGSLHKLRGKSLNPSKPEDVEENKDNLIKGVYATDKKEVAIAMAIITDRCSATLHLKPKKGYYSTVYEGWPTRKIIYLYYLPKNKFFESPRGSHQFVSKNSVKVIKTETIKVKNYIHLLKKANKKEKAIWNKKVKSYNNKK